MIYRTIDTGVFLDLSSFFEEDNSFNRNEINMAVLDVGLYKGGRYIVPINYSLPILFSLEDRLNTTSFL